MSLLTSFEKLYAEAKRSKWIRYFAVFCRITLAAGFIPAGIVKVTGERFTGLPSNNPLGHYFDALFLTRYYYTFVGVGQLTAALLLLIPRTALLGAILYFPIIMNIWVLASATRFNGTRLTTLMLLANLFLLVWDYDRLKPILTIRQAVKDHHVPVRTSKFPIWFFGFVLAAIQTAAMRGDDRTKALHENLSGLLKMDEPRKRYGAMMSALDIHYDLGAGHPLLGRRMPDLEVATTDGPRRVFTLLHGARPVLLDLGEPGALDIAGWVDRVQRVEARYAGGWELPVLGAVAAPTAVLIRPDGHVAWVGAGTDQGLREALTTWFGPPV